MAFKKSKSNLKTLTALEHVIVDAYDCGSLSEEVYDSLVRLGVRDSRAAAKVDKWPGQLTWGEIPPVESIVAEVPQPLRLEETEMIKDAEYAELEPIENYESPEIIQGDPAPTDSGSFPIEDSAQQLGSSATCSDLPGAQSDIPVSIAEDEDRREERNPGGSYLFTWCVECLRVEWFWSGDKNLPEEVGFGSDAEHGTVLHCCGMHGQSRRADNKNNFGFGWTEAGRGPAQKPVKINAMAWKGTEIIEVARAVIGQEVRMMADGQGCTAFVDVENVLGVLGPNDQAGSINLERFRHGGRKRDDLMSPFLAGGLLSRKVDN